MYETQKLIKIVIQILNKIIFNNLVLLTQSFQSHENVILIIL